MSFLSTLSPSDIRTTSQIYHFPTKALQHDQRGAAVGVRDSISRHEVITASSFIPKFPADIRYSQQHRDLDARNFSTLVNNSQKIIQTQYPTLDVSPNFRNPILPSRNLSALLEELTTTTSTLTHPFGLHSHTEKPFPHQYLSVSTTTSSDIHQDSSSSYPHHRPSSILPVPDWPHALHEWGVFWYLYVWGFAFLFLAIAVSSALLVFRFRVRARRLRIVCNTLILVGVAGSMRVALLLGQALVRHETSRGSKMTTLATGLLTQGAYPLMCASFGLTQVSLQRLTNVAAGPAGGSKLRSMSWLLGCGLGNIFLVVLVETLVAYRPSLKLLLLLDSGMFIAWALYLSITYICAGFRLTEYALETKRARKELAAFSNHRRAVSINKRDPQNNLVGDGNEHLQLSLSINNIADNSLNNNNDTNNEGGNGDNFGDISQCTALRSEPGDVSNSSNSFLISERPSTLNFDLNLVRGSSVAAEPGEIVVKHGSPLSPSLLSTVQSPLYVANAQGQRSTARLSQPRLSRAQLRMTDDERMMVTIATENEDGSTSSTDVDYSALLAPSSPQSAVLTSRSASASPSHAQSIIPYFNRRKSQQKRRKKTKSSKIPNAVFKRKTFRENSESPSSRTSPVPSQDNASAGQRTKLRGKLRKIDRRTDPTSYNTISQCCEMEDMLNLSDTDSVSDNQELASGRISPQKRLQPTIQHNIQPSLENNCIQMVETSCISAKSTEKHTRKLRETAIGVEEIESLELEQKHLTGLSSRHYFNDVPSSNKVLDIGSNTNIDAKDMQEAGAKRLEETVSIDMVVRDNEIETSVNDEPSESHPVLTLCSSLRDNGYLADTEHPATFTANTGSGVGSKVISRYKNTQRKPSFFSSLFSRLDNNDANVNYENTDDDSSIDSWIDDGPS
ncbi:hypothetical protein ElyMa_003634400, partial [Elysia marginata]